MHDRAPPRSRTTLPSYLQSLSSCTASIDLKAAPTAAEHPSTPSYSFIVSTSAARTLRYAADPSPHQFEQSTFIMPGTPSALYSSVRLVLTPVSLVWSPIFAGYGAFLVGNVSLLRVKTDHCK